MHSALPIVGREREQERVQALVERLSSGQGGLLLVSGEAGIGKTTLVGELTRSARERGLLLLAGACYDLTTTAPYAPWQEVSAAYPESDPLPPLPDELRPGYGIGQLEGQPALFDLVRDFFTEVVSFTPAVIVLEDLHWADQGSLDLLRYLVRQLQAQPVLFVGTYRDDELTRDHPLSKILPHLIREGRANRIWLQRIDEPALRHLVHDRYQLSDGDESRLAKRLFQLTNGNPLFASEMLRTLEEQQIVTSNGAGNRLGDLNAVQVPPLIVQLIESRLYQLDDATRRMLEMASVIGQDVPIDLWQLLSEADDEALASAIERAVALHLMAEAPGGQRLQFTHALIREAIYRGILIVRRIGWHRRAAQLLADHPRPSAAVVAYHYEQANDPGAITWRIQAGDDARSLYAPDTAINHYSAAIELAREHGVALPLDVTYHRGQAHATIGSFDRAREDFETTLRDARLAGDQRTVWQVLTELGALWGERDYARTGEYLQQALELARKFDDPVMLATSLNRYGNWHLNIQEIDRAVEYYGEALEIFQELNDEAGQAASFDLLAVGKALRGDLASAEEAGRFALSYYRRLGDRQGEAQALSHLTLCAQLEAHDPLVPSGLSVQEAADAGERAVQITRDIRWRAGEVYCLCMLGALYAETGRLGQALDHATTALQLAEDIKHRQWQAFSNHVLYRIWYAIQHPERARNFAERELRIGREVSSSIWTYRGSADLALSLIALGEVDEAQRVLDQARAADLPILSSEQAYLAYSRASLLLTRNEPGAALAMLDRIRDEIPRRTPDEISPRNAYLRGRVLIALGRHDDAVARLTAAAALLAQRGMRTLQWRVELALARALAASGDSSASEQRRKSAESTMHGIAAEIDDEALRSEFVRRALESQPEDAPAVQPEEPPGDLAGLSRRQIEVLRLVAHGLTDAEVAEQLSISPRTVGGHLQTIYSKLGVSSRVEATRVALENGVV